MTAERTLRATQAATNETLRVTLENTAQTLKVTQANADQSAEVTRRGQLADRFSRSVDQLGSREKGGPNGQGTTKLIEPRLGAIYALERIAEESKDHYGPILEVLTAYVRENAHWDGQPTPDHYKEKGAVPRVLGGRDLGRAEPDIQAVLDVLGRRAKDRIGMERPISLNGSDLMWAWMDKIQLPRADLRNCRLTRASLGEANLQEAGLEGVEAWGANLTKARLEKAHLDDVQFHGAVLIDARLDRSDLRGANFYGADLTGASLKGTNLRSSGGPGEAPRPTDLSGVKKGSLVPEQLEGAEWDNQTLFPTDLEQWAESSGGRSG